ncbi:hypothetical protein SCUCBS95973_007126 [Sporothrix curviconia]|uniref:FAD-binding FR-type domain-containing protein n=1 Tax=Sporothrix curviconia TaxID=1260050 RepID=A0ABP0CDD7_9PEZI
MADGTSSPTTAYRLLLTHRTSRRVTASISFHCFWFVTSPDHDSDPGHASSPPLLQRWLRPTQNVTLQFPADLDPAGGKHGMSVADRRCTFTPCRGDSSQIDILTRNGRVTGLLGLPRPYQTLTAEVLEVGGGFSAAALAAASVCIAGGTGIAPFLTMGASEAGTRAKGLCWSVRSDDFGAVEFALQEQLLRAEDWAGVSIFVTSGEDGVGVVAEKPAAWWETTLTTLQEAHPARNLSFARRRMAAADIAVDVGEDGQSGQNKTILFCGSKSLEWQVRMWAMMAVGGATVHCTEMV